MTTPSNKDLGRSLDIRRDNYKKMHYGTAEKKGVIREFLAARTLTEMRKILWGHKPKHKRGIK